MRKKLGNINIGDKMKIKDIIKYDFIVCDENDLIIEIAKKMKEFNIGFMPIIKENDIVGVITDRDICIYAASNNDISNKVKNYMNTSIVYIDEEKSAKEALALMMKEKIKRLLVTRKNEVIGVLSLSDLLDKENEKIVLKTIKTIFHKNKIVKQKEAEIDEFYL